MVKKSNPGLARRFALDDAFIFHDYSDSELMQILNLKLASKGLTANFEAQKAARDILEKMRMKPNFGNGGSVETLISSSIMRMEQRQKTLSAVERAKDASLLAVDFNPSWNGGKIFESVDVKELLKDMVGSVDLIEQFESYKQSVEFAVRLGRSPFADLPMNFRFVGPPGILLFASRFIRRNR
jgi:hypothetical protein